MYTCVCIHIYSSVCIYSCIFIVSSSIIAVKLIFVPRVSLMYEKHHAVHAKNQTKDLLRYIPLFPKIMHYPNRLSLCIFPNYPKNPQGFVNCSPRNHLANPTQTTICNTSAIQKLGSLSPCILKARLGNTAPGPFPSGLVALATIVATLPNTCAHTSAKTT